MNWLRAFRGFRFELFYQLTTSRKEALIRLGQECAWSIHDGYLNAKSRVLCVGAGHDISFEKALIARYGCRVVLLDPSPTGIATAQKEALPDSQLRFLPVALSDQDGKLSFQPPADAAEGSYQANGTDQAAIQFPARCLPSLMHELGWEAIELLKMDVEGCEYGVLDQILKKQIPIYQICLEYHYGTGFSHSRGEMVRSILKLRRAGFKLIHHLHRDHTFLHTAHIRFEAGRPSR